MAERFEHVGQFVNYYYRETALPVITGAVDYPDSYVEINVTDSGLMIERYNLPGSLLTLVNHSARPHRMRGVEYLRFYGLGANIPTKELDWLGVSACVDEYPDLVVSCDMGFSQFEVVPDDSGEQSSKLAYHDPVAVFGDRQLPGLYLCLERELHDVYSRMPETREAFLSVAGVIFNQEMPDL